MAHQSEEEAEAVPDEKGERDFPGQKRAAKNQVQDQQAVWETLVLEEAAKAHLMAVEAKDRTHRLPEEEKQKERAQAPG